MELKINFAAVSVAVVVSFILGALWYTVLFGKAWAREHGYDPNMKPDSKVMAKGMLFMLIGQILFVWVFAHNIAAWMFVPGMQDMNPAANALSAAVFTWLGFYFPNLLGSTVWEKKSWKLFFIDGGYNLVTLLAVAIILTHWR